MLVLTASLLLACNELCVGSLKTTEPDRLIVRVKSTMENPFLSEQRRDEPEVGQRGDNPFHGPEDDRLGTASGCGPTSTLANAELRKPEIAATLCESRFEDLDDEWIFILYYVRGFNEFLEERGSFMDPTGACSRAVEPRASLGLVYGVIDRALSGDLSALEDERFKAMRKPFEEDWKRAPFIVWELNVWKREGRLDATSVASRGMCGDPAFQLFWRKAIEYSQRVPTVDS